MLGITIIALIIGLRYSGIDQYINFETIKAHRNNLLDFTHNHALLAVAFFIIAYIVTTSLSLPIAAPLSVLGGFLFSIFPAALYINIGATIGAAITFLLFRYLLGTTVQKKYSEQLAAFNTNIEQYGTLYLLTVRLTPLVPFFLVNILASLTTLSVRTFIWTTSLGIIPGSLVYAYAGKKLGEINALNEIFSFKIIGLFLLLITLSLIALVIKKYKLFNQVNLLKKREHL